MDHRTAPYVITKPLDASQKILGEDEKGKTFSIRVILNFELERELLGFGARIKIPGPRILKKWLSDQLNRAVQQYS